MRFRGLPEALNPGWKDLTPLDALCRYVPDCSLCTYVCPFASYLADCGHILCQDCVLFTRPSDDGERTLMPAKRKGRCGKCLKTVAIVGLRGDYLEFIENMRLKCPCGFAGTLREHNVHSRQCDVFEAPRNADTKTKKSAPDDEGFAILSKPVESVLVAVRKAKEETLKQVDLNKRELMSIMEDVLDHVADVGDRLFDLADSISNLTGGSSQIDPDIADLDLTLKTQASGSTAKGNSIKEASFFSLPPSEAPHPDRMLGSSTERSFGAPVCKAHHPDQTTTYPKEAPGLFKTAPTDRSKTGSTSLSRSGSGGQCKTLVQRKDRSAESTNLANASRTLPLNGPLNPPPSADEPLHSSSQPITHDVGRIRQGKNGDVLFCFDVARLVTISIRQSHATVASDTLRSSDNFYGVTMAIELVDEELDLLIGIARHGFWTACKKFTVSMLDHNELSYRKESFNSWDGKTFIQQRSETSDSSTNDTDLYRVRGYCALDKLRRTPFYVKQRGCLAFTVEVVHY